jgi:DNA-binding transcriptional LysR family regulator
MDPDLSLFDEVVRAGSLSAAARRRGTSPAMVSKRLARLESRLGVRLIHRTTRRMELTARGEAFHRDVEAILEAIRVAEEKVRDADAEPSGVLRVSAPTSFGRLHIAPALGGFLEAHPRVALELDLSDAFEDLVGARIDVAIRIAASIGADARSERLADSPRVLCAAPAYLARHGEPASLDDLRNHSLLAATGQLPWLLSGPDGDIEVDGESRVRTNSSEVVRELTLSGLGVSLRSLWDVGEDLTARRLVRVLPWLEGSANVGIYAVASAAPAGAAARAFIAHLRQTWSERPSWSGAIPVGGLD